MTRPNPLAERGCFACGEKTGGNLRKHKSDCSYIKMLCETVPACKEFVEGKEHHFDQNKRKTKHSFGEAS